MIKSTKQKAAEAEVAVFAKDRGPFVVAAQDTRMPMVFTDARAAHDPIVFANDSFLALTGYQREDLLGRSLGYLMPRGNDPDPRSEVSAAFLASSGSTVEIACQRKDGETFWAAIFISPVRDHAGDIVQHFVSFIDLTRRRRREEHLRLLLDELNHRTQNTLAVVQAIAAQTLTGDVDKTVVDAFRGRVLALSKAHRLLGREDWRGTDMREMLEHILAPFGLGGTATSPFTVEGDAIRLQPKPAMTLAMVFHELATNSVKHGALSSGDGKVEIDWKVQPGPLGQSLWLQWRESGGPPVAPSGHKGFGSRLIENSLARELGGEVSLLFPPSGAVCQITMPFVSDTGA